MSVQIVIAHNPYQSFDSFDSFDQLRIIIHWFDYAHHYTLRTSSLRINEKVQLTEYIS